MNTINSKEIFDTSSVLLISDEVITLEELELPDSMISQKIENGALEGAYEMGLFYLFGDTFPQNIAAGEKLIRYAAEKGYPIAQLTLGLMYSDGTIPTDYKEAIKWVKRAAEAGEMESQAKMGAVFELGLWDIPKDFEKAKFWYLKSASQGCADAQHNLGVMYLHGRSVEQDYFIAAQWFSKAAAQGHLGSQSNLGFLYENGLGVEKDLFLAIFWYHKAAELGSAVAQFNLGVAYMNGSGVAKDIEVAKKWICAAANNGFEQAKIAACFF